MTLTRPSAGPFFSSPICVSYIHDSRCACACKFAPRSP
jgi:hypothetical protein